MSDAVVKCLKHINDISSSNIVRNGNVFSPGEKIMFQLTGLVRISRGFHHKILTSLTDIFCFSGSL